MNDRRHAIRCCLSNGHTERVVQRRVDAQSRAQHHRCQVVGRQERRRQHRTGHSATHMACHAGCQGRGRRRSTHEGVQRCIAAHHRGTATVWCWLRKRLHHVRKQRGVLLGSKANTRRQEPLPGGHCRVPSRRLGSGERHGSCGYWNFLRRALLLIDHAPHGSIAMCHVAQRQLPYSATQVWQHHVDTGPMR